jgi:peptidyl-dipeptidase A
VRAIHRFAAAPFAAIALASLALAAACGGEPGQAPCPQTPAAMPLCAPTLASATPVTAGPPTVEEATAFVAAAEKRIRKAWVDGARADWINQTDITDDTESLSADGAAETARVVGEAIVQAKRFDAIRDQLPPDVARKLYLLSVAQTIPAPADAAKREELARLGTTLGGEYAKGTYCPPAGSPLLKYVKKDAGAAPGKPACLHLDDLSRVLAKSRSDAELTEAWKGWHAIAVPMKSQYARWTELANQGAKELGFDDVGAMWRAGYDMTPAEFEADVERLWKDVKPLYDALHCYVRSQLQKTYGKDKVADHAPIPAELLGNMWAQQWNNVYDLVTPYPKEPALDVDKRMAAGGAGGAGGKWDSVKLVQTGEHFFTSLGFDPLPKTFWERSMLSRPRDREVVCHASAWDVTFGGDLRVKACFEPNEEQLLVAHHELGHDFYFQRYFNLPILFQQGANDGFHEAIGDTIALSVTPDYLRSLGLLGPAGGGAEHTRINQQMKMALEKVAFLPFGLLIDKWRWDVFAGKTAPADYESSWWALKRQYQGVTAPVSRGADDFDPGAKNHVATGVPYMRYFLAHIYQFQFHKALCQAAGFTGPLDQCSIHDSKAAGAKLMAMLALGASKPWPDAMETVGAGRKADAGPMLEYFKPLQQWLADQTKGQSCGW